MDMMNVVKKGRGRRQGRTRGANLSEDNQTLEDALWSLRLSGAEAGAGHTVRRTLSGLRSSSSTNNVGMGITDPASSARPVRISSETKATWSEVAEQSRDAVVKILAQCVAQDWELPFRRADDSQAIGSGFFVSADGIIVTNAHVVEDSVKLWVTLPSEGERRFPAKVLGVCFDVDLAVIQATDAPVQKYLEFGDSNTVAYGQEILTLGYPLGMESLKLTEGIISGRQDSFFQTDAPLNPGNSGGPMLDKTGKVIGINVAIMEESNNVGFAIPSYHLTTLYNDLCSRPKDALVVQKPVLGADFCNCSDALLELAGCKGRQGYYVRRSYEGFPMHNAGVRDGDILHSFNGFKLDSFGNAKVPWSQYSRESVESLMSLLNWDSKPEIIYTHDGEEKKAQLDFEDKKNPGYPLLPVVRQHYPPLTPAPDFEVFAGMVVMELTMNHVVRFHEPDEASMNVVKQLTPIATSFTAKLEPSLVVTSVFVGSGLSRVDVFNAGTLIDKVNGEKCKNLEDFRKALMKPVVKNGELYVTFTSKQNEKVALKLTDTLKEEFENAENYMYRVSPIVMKTLDDNKGFLKHVFKGDKEGRKRFLAQMQAAKKEEEVMKAMAANEDDDSDED